MPSEKRKTRNPDLRALLESLAHAGVEFILVGGLAAVVQGAPITTMDVDIVHHQTADNIAKLIGVLKSIGAHHRRLDDTIIAPAAEHLSGRGHCLLKTRFGPLDVLAFIEEGQSYAELLPHTLEIEFRGHVIRVLNLETLIELKKRSQNSRDRQRLPVLQETLRQLEHKKGWP